MLLFEKVAVVDIEATCWSSPPQPPDERSEIIEIGIAIVDMKKLAISESVSLPIKPVVSKVSAFCTELTGWTQEELDKVGMPFRDALLFMERYDLQDKLWISQGNYDREMFRQQCLDFKVPYPFGKNHMNLQHMFSLLTSRRRGLGMKKQLDLLGLELQGRHHNGGDDAKNIARVFIELIKRGKFTV